MITPPPAPRRKHVMPLDAVVWPEEPRDLLRVDSITDGVACCSKIDREGKLQFVTMPDGRRFALRGVSHYEASRLSMVDGIPFVRYPECEFCGDPADRIEPLEDGCFVCDTCSA